jgi:hypothetical protein
MKALKAASPFFSIRCHGYSPLGQMDWLGGSGRMSIKQGGRMVKGKKGKPITHTLSRQGRGNQFNFILLDGRGLKWGGYLSRLS